MNWFQFQPSTAKDIVLNFPALFDQAQSDWAKFKVGVSRGLFSVDQKQSILDWYRDFPKLWESIKPNFEDVMLEQTGSYNVTFVPKVDAWVATLKSDKDFSGLGIAPVVVAGVLVVGGLAVALWAVAYIKRQANISKLVDGVTAGRIPADVLSEAIQAEKSAGIFSGATDLLKWAAIGLAAWFLLPPVLKMFSGRSAKSA